MGEETTRTLKQNPDNKYGVIIRTPNGDCTINWVGGGAPEQGQAFEYKDTGNHFYFYADAAWDGSFFDIKIEHATTDKFHGPNPWIHPDHLDAIKAAIRTFFENRWFLNSSQPRPETEHLREIMYSWHLRA